MVACVRTNLPRVLAVLLSVCLLTQAPAFASTQEELRRQQQQTERRGERLDDEIDATRDEMAQTRAQRRDTLSRLERIDGERTELVAELDQLTAELTDAEGALAEAEQAVRRTEVEITRADEELARTGRELETRRELLKARARATYMHGRVSYAEAVLDVTTANELGVSMQYLRSMLNEDSDQVEQIATLEHQNEAFIDRLDTLRAAQDEARAQRATERDRVAGLVAERREVEMRLDARAREHEAVLAELAADLDSYEAALADMAAESDAIEDRLADIATEQRRLERQRAAERRGSAGSSGGQSSGGGSSGGGSSGGGSPQPTSGQFQWPVNGPVTSGFGYRTHPVLGTQRLHAGVDFGAATGTPIVAAEAGRVVSAGWRGGYGNAVIIDHGGGLATLYGHQSRLAVSAGTSVSRGQVIGYVGSTGMSTGPHLHFELRRNGAPVDPMSRL
jgi:murein DD-endopeptidase MepM/ murein hydrolase activator NlpD